MPQHERNTVSGRAKHLFNKLTYNVWRRELMKFRRTQLERPLQIVDIGCGPVFLLSCFANCFPDMVLIGVDQSEELLGVAKRRCPKMIPLVGDASSVPLPDGYADVTFALHVVEHLYQSNLFDLARAKRSP
jgi:trans-aconitate methyltransferase